MTLLTVVVRLGVPQDDLFEARSCTILYQDLYRSSLRDSKTTDRVECVVPCLPSASALVQRFHETTPIKVHPARAWRLTEGPGQYEWFHGIAVLASLLPGWAVEIMPEHLIPVLAEPAKRGPKPTGRTPDAERARKSRAAKRAAMEHAKEREKESV